MFKRKSVIILAKTEEQNAKTGEQNAKTGEQNAKLESKM